jgi:nitrogen fixation-related uncharacterized protein
MKKGVLISWNKLVEAIPYIVVFVGLIALFWALGTGFFSKPRSPAEQDFARIIRDLDDLLAQRYIAPDSITVPVQITSVLDIVMYPKGASPKSCQGKACICLYETKGGKYVEHCKIYDFSNVCPSECGPVCLTQVQRLSLLPGDSSVTVSRGCNDISIT